MATETWIDVSVPLHDRVAIFPGTREVRIRRVQDVDDGDPATISELQLSTHSGTHIDAPVHFLPDGAGVDAVALAALNGPARVLDLCDEERIGRDQLDRHEIGAGDRILLRTRNSKHIDPPWHERDFDPDYAHLAASGARHLAARGAATIGIDYLSIGGDGRDNDETHRILLEAGIAVLEGLALEHVEPGDYELTCLPLRIPGADGAPARALLGSRAA